MDNIIFKDNMKRDSKFFLAFIIFALILIIANIVGYYVGPLNYSHKDFIKTMILFSSVALFGILGSIETGMYSIEVTKNQIKLRTMFRRVELDFLNISHYTYKRYLKSSYYQFRFYTQNTKFKSLLVNTHYPEKMIAILNSRNVGIHQINEQPPTNNQQ